MKEKNNNANPKINFFKRIWYSITKFDKYMEMAEEGTKVATKYLAKIILIMSLIIAIIGIFDINQNINKGINFIEEEVPEFTYKDNQLESDISEVYKKKDEILGIGNIIIDLQTEEESKIEEYTTEIETSQEGTGIIILKNKILQVVEIDENEESQINEISYEYIASSLLGKTDSEFSKSDIINFLSKDGRTYIIVINFIIYLIGYFISYFITTFVYVILIVLIGNLTAMITRVKLKIKTLYSISIYALTLSNILSILYFIIRYFTGWYITYFDIAYIAIAYVYIVTVIFLMKSDINRKQENPIEESKQESGEEFNQEEIEEERTRDGEQ